MTLIQNSQPGDSEAPEEALAKPTITDAIASLSGPGAPSASDKVALQFPPDICLKIDKFLEQDSDIITMAADDIVNQYYQVVNMFLEHMLNKRTCTDTQRVQFLHLKITRSHHLSQLREYSSQKRRQNDTKKTLSLLQIFSKWETTLGHPNGFSFLGAIQNTASMTQSGSLEKTTAGGIAAYNARTTPPKATQTQPPEVTPKSTTGGTAFVIPTVDFGPDGKIIVGGEEVPQPTPAPPAAPTKPITVPDAIKATNGAAIATATPVTPPPEAPDDGWGHVLAPADEQLENDIDIFNHPGLPTIIHIHGFRPPASPESWKTTLANLETAMSISLAELREETNQEKIYGRMVNALAKTGSTQYRRKFLQEIHALAKNSQGTNQRAIMEIFKNVLSNQPAYSRPRRASEAMEAIYNQPNSNRPEPEDITPASLFRGYGELDKVEITEMPAELQEPIRELLESSRAFGLAPIASNVTTTAQGPQVDIGKMTPQNFRLMCTNIFHRLQTIEEQVKIQAFKASTWRGKSPIGKARAFTKKLQEIFAAQFAIIEELLFSDELLIPEQVRGIV